MVLCLAHARRSWPFASTSQVMGQYGAWWEQIVSAAPGLTLSTGMITSLMMDHAKIAPTPSTYWVTPGSRVALKICMGYLYVFLDFGQLNAITLYLMGSFLAGFIHEALYPFNSELFLAILRKSLGYGLFKLGENKCLYQLSLCFEPGGRPREKIHTVS